MDDLLKKVKMDNKYKFVRLVIKRVRQLINEKEKMSLIGSNKKLTSIVFEEIKKGKFKTESFIEEK